MPEKTKKHQFKADIVKLLDIITHSVYTNREIFVRELISNASDALEKLRFEQSRGARVCDPDLPLNISITTDKDNATLTIADTGIGMTEEELVNNIGSIAHSGSEDFVKALSPDAAQASSIIGRFGVGFYSVFMAGRKVVLTTRSAWPDEKARVWISDGMSGYELREATGEVPRGTSIEIHLKDDAKEFADPDHLKEIIDHHSHFIPFPILVDGLRVNTTPALWREPKTSVTPEQYKEFYSFLTHDPEAPALTMHMNVDAPVQFSALAFVPAKADEFFGMKKPEGGLDLYARRVLIAKEAPELLPEYLRFCRGVVDTEDLPLNISRETLQENAVLRRIAQAVTKDILAALRKKASTDPDGYKALWKEHAAVFKLGYADFLNREAFAELLRFDASSLSGPGALTSLDDYAARAPEGQKTIYYLSGPSRDALEITAHLEMFRRKGIEVLYLYEPIDEFMLESMGSFKELSFKSAEQAKAQDLAGFPDAAASGPETPPLTAEQSARFTGLLARMKDILGARIKDVRGSERLRSSPSLLVAADGRASSQMQRIMRLMRKDETIPDKIMEVNPGHLLTRNLLAIFTADPDDPFIVQATEQLFESALLLEGYLADPHAMVRRVNAILEEASGWHAARGAALK